MSEATAVGGVARKPKKWQRRGESVWRALIERQRRSGVSLERFCRSERVSRSSFARWRGMLSLSDPRRSSPLSVAKDSDSPVPRPRWEGFRLPLERSEGSRFIDAGMIGGGDRSAEPVEIRLDLGGGVVLTIRRG